MENIVGSVTESEMLETSLESGKRTPVNRPSLVGLALEVRDPEVIAELLRFPAGDERNCYALGGLRLGVLALRAATGQFDAVAVREVGNDLLSKLSRELDAHSRTLTGDLCSALQNYFDPKTGLVPQRIQSLVQRDGELEQVLRAHLASEESMLARTLAERVGENSPIFKALSPTEKDGVVGRLEALINRALEEQRNALIREFSLDDERSALSRFGREIVGKNGELASQLESSVATAIGEFSLDRPESALSRLAAKVENTQAAIAAEFSSDNEKSIINRLSHLLEAASAKIDSYLTLDEESSSLWRLKREVLTLLSEHAKKNEDFQSEVRSTLVGLQVRKEEARRSTVHGVAFEEELGNFLSIETQRLGDVLQRVGARTGAIANCKKGDFLTELGPESPAPGELIVWEAKENQSYGLRDALEEIDLARKNRRAQIGIFVFSAAAAPAGLDSLGRYGKNIVAVWDPVDPTTDLSLKAAYTVARALTLRAKDASKHTQDTGMQLESAARSIEKQIKYLDEFKRYGDNMKRDGDKMSERAERMKSDLVREIERLDTQVAALRTDAASSSNV